MSTYNTRRKIGVDSDPNRASSSGRTVSFVHPWEPLLSNTVHFACRLTAPTLFAIGAGCALSANFRDDYALIALSLCLCACAAALFAEGLIREAYRRDRALLVYVATHPGSTPWQSAQVLGGAVGRATQDFGRLSRDQLLVPVVAAADPAHRSYRLASHDEGRDV